jgi:hypothetical protein
MHWSQTLNPIKRKFTKKINYRKNPSFDWKVRLIVETRGSDNKGINDAFVD